MNGLASIRTRARGRSPEQSVHRDSGNVVSGAQKRSGYVGNFSGRKRGRDGSDGDAKSKKRPHDGAGPSSDGSGGGGGVFISSDEMKARYLARVCLYCGVAGQQKKDCTSPKSVTPCFAKQGQNGSS